MLTRVTTREDGPERERAARQSSADEQHQAPIAALTPAAVLALQRSGAGNAVIARAVLARTVKSGDAMRQIDKLVQLLGFADLDGLMKLRAEIKEIKNAPISVDQETRLGDFVAKLQNGQRNAIAVQALMGATDVGLTRSAQAI